MLDYEGSRSEFLKLLAEFGEEPAFIARARAQEVALESLLHHCKAKHEEMLVWPYRHLSSLAQRIGANWSSIAPYLVQPESVAEIEALHSQMSSKDATNAGWSSAATIRGTLKQFVESAERFNRGWHAYLAGIDYEAINKLRRDYNQYYSLEKACAFGNERISEDFQPLPMIDVAFLESPFPYLLIPQIV